MKKAILLIGPPGCGKDTQKKIILQNHPDYKDISTGDIIREKMKSYTGKYVDDEVIYGMINEHMDTMNIKDNDIIIFNGFPRTVPQIEYFEKNGISLELILGFENITDENLIKRIGKRGERDSITPQQRLQDFADKTLPVMYLLKINHENKYIKIDASKNEDEINTYIESKLKL